MTKPKKVKSGWQTQVYLGTDEQGKSHFKKITRQYKWQVVQEAELLESSNTPVSNLGVTVRQAVEKYISLATTLEESTLAGYRRILNYGFPTLMEMEISKLTEEIVQKEINNECGRTSLQRGGKISAKTVKNEWGLISAALKKYGVSFNVRLPSVQHDPQILPEPEVVLEIIKGKSIELPCLLAMWMSLRLSEVRGIMCDAIQGDTLCVKRTVVRVNGKDVIKERAKNDTSKRTLKIPPYILELINNTTSYQNYLETGENQPLITISGSGITNQFNKLMKKNGLAISFHDLRHEFASIALTKLDIDIKTVQLLGGWKTMDCLLKRYSEGFNKEKEIAYEKQQAFFTNLL